MNRDLVNISLLEDSSGIVILDQTQLPNRETYLTLHTLPEFYTAIQTLQVRGAPAIGVFAGYAIYVCARAWADCTYPEFASRFAEAAATLGRARPTAVNLGWALSRMKRVVTGRPSLPIPALLSLLEAECRAIHTEDIQMCRAISAYGLSLLRDGDGVLTHCNAGPLATSRYGTGQGPLYLALERGMRLRIFADETRPLLQGARLTAYELQRAGADVTLICDNMAAMVMKNGWIDCCMVGCDRVAANGDVANKIGTSGVAILAHHYGIPFYVLGPSSTVDFACENGAGIEIELRDGDEIREKFFREPAAPAGVKCFNPAFDITDHSLITAIITEQGVCLPPFQDNLPHMLRKEGPA